MKLQEGFSLKHSNAGNPATAALDVDLAATKPVLHAADGSTVMVGKYVDTIGTVLLLKEQPGPAFNSKPNYSLMGQTEKQLQTTRADTNESLQDSVQAYERVFAFTNKVRLDCVQCVNGHSASVTSSSARYLTCHSLSDEGGEAHNCRSSNHAGPECSIFRKRLAAAQGELQAYACKADGLQRAVQELENQLAEKDQQMALLTSMIQEPLAPPLLDTRLAQALQLGHWQQETTSPAASAVSTMSFQTTAMPRDDAAATERLINRFTAAANDAEADRKQLLLALHPDSLNVTRNSRSSTFSPAFSSPLQPEYPAASAFSSAIRESAVKGAERAPERPSACMSSCDVKGCQHQYINLTAVQLPGTNADGDSKTSSGSVESKVDSDGDDDDVIELGTVYLHPAASPGEMEHAYTWTAAAGDPNAASNHIGHYMSRCIGRSLNSSCNALMSSAWSAVHSTKANPDPPNVEAAFGRITMSCDNPLFADHYADS
eukprot:gene10626-10784_t